MSKTMMCSVVIVGTLAAGALRAQVSKTIQGEMKTVTVTVEAIEKGSREVTVKKPDGNYDVLYVPRDVKRFDTLKIGDKITARYYENMDLTGAASDLGHILTDTIGAGRLGPRIDIERFTLHDRDVVLLCTNGLTDAVSEQEMASILSDGSPEPQAERLIARALAAGAEDDATVVVARYQDRKSVV